MYVSHVCLCGVKTVLSLHGDFYQFTFLCVIQYQRQPNSWVCRLNAVLFNWQWEPNNEGERQKNCDLYKTYIFCIPVKWSYVAKFYICILMMMYVCMYLHVLYLFKYICIWFMYSCIVVLHYIHKYLSLSLLFLLLFSANFRLGIFSLFSSFHLSACLYGLCGNNNDDGVGLVVCL